MEFPKGRFERTALLRWVTSRNVVVSVLRDEDLWVNNQFRHSPGFNYISPTRERGTNQERLSFCKPARRGNVAELARVPTKSGSDPNSGEFRYRRSEMRVTAGPPVAGRTP